MSPFTWGDGRHQPSLSGVLQSSSSVYSPPGEHLLETLVPIKATKGEASKPAPSWLVWILHQQHSLFWNIHSRSLEQTEYLFYCCTEINKRINKE